MLSDIVTNLAAMQIGAAAMYTAIRVGQRVQQRSLHREVRSFFGDSGKIIIIHSSIRDLDEGIPTYNYPATDTRAARTLARLLESAGLREGREFTILPNRPDRAMPDKLSELNIVLLCGPARNSAYEKIMASAPPMRYSLTAEGDGKNILHDGHRNQQLQATRELPDGASASPYDWGLIASLPNRHNSSKRLVVLAGIHGTGTVGAAEFVTDPANLRILNRRRDGDTISEVVRVDYDDGDIETPTDITLD